MVTSRQLIRVPNPKLADGQLGGHVKRGVAHPEGARTGAAMALISALPLAPGSDKMVLTFLDRYSPVDSFDYKPNSGDNAVIIVPKDEVFLSGIFGVCPGDWKGAKIAFGDEMEEPVDLDIDPTGLDLDASDAWVDMVDGIGCDCTKFGGYPIWQNIPVDIDDVMGKPMHFHHRISADIIDFELGDGYVIYVFVSEDETDGCVLWQRLGGGSETTYNTHTSGR